MISIETVLVVWVFVMAICLGSFLNVVILRGFSGESIVLPPSKCPHCSPKCSESLENQCSPNSYAVMLKIDLFNL